MAADQEVVTLAEGIEAAKSGNSARARELFRSVITMNPRSEIAWLWLSSVVENDAQRRECLQRVLQINPLNEAARRGLESLGERPPTTVGPAPAPQVAAQSTAVSGEPVQCPFCSNATSSSKASCEQCGEDVILPCPSCMKPILLWETTRCPCGEGLRHYIFFPDGIDHEGLGQRYAIMERWDAAAHQWSRALSEGSHVVMLHRKLAQAYERMGDAERASYHRQITTS